MLKLYIGEGEKMVYNEAWIDGDSIVEHIGKIGTKGRTRYHERDPELSDEQNIKRILEPAVRGGYKQIDLEDHAMLLVEYAVDGFGTPDDIEKRYRLQDRLDETLGWTGLGHCDGGSIGSGTMEAACFVVDFAIAKEVVENDLRGTEFENFTRIYNERDDY